MTATPLNKHLQQCGYSFSLCACTWLGFSYSESENPSSRFGVINVAIVFIRRDKSVFIKLLSVCCVDVPRCACMCEWEKKGIE